MAERKPPEYYNTQKLWYPEGKEPLPEERFYSDPNVEKGIIPALKSIANAPRELKEMKMEYHKSKGRDAFGFGVEQIDEATKNAQRIAKDHMYVWNRLIENKGPIGMKKDEQQPQERLKQLFDDDGFKNFLSGKTIQDKMVALRDVGIYQGMDMSDEELARFLMTHAASGLTEDPNVHKEAKQNINPTEGYGNIPYISKALKRRDDAMNPEGY